MQSLPIEERPDFTHSTSYDRIRVARPMAEDLTLGGLVKDLTNGVITPQTLAHLDPDLDSQSLERKPGWRPVFGQSSAAETHLERTCGIGAGDIFLFFGWFRKVEKVDAKFRYCRGSPNLHVIFGWLQIEQRIELPRDLAKVPDYARGHPHHKEIPYDSPESLYISRERLSLEGATEYPGAGVFRKFNQTLCLTNPEGNLRSHWRLPQWFYPAGRPALTYHPEIPGRWEMHEDYCFLRSAGKGQEFVLDCADYPEAIPWLVSLLKARATMAAP